MEQVWCEFNKETASVLYFAIAQNEYVYEYYTDTFSKLFVLMGENASKSKTRKLRPRKLRFQELRPAKLRPQELRPQELRPRKLRSQELRRH